MPAGISGCFWNVPSPLGGSSAGCLEGLTGIGKSASLLLPVRSPSHVPDWQNLTGNQLAKQKRGWHFSHPSLTNWNFEKVRLETE